MHDRVGTGGSGVVIKHRGGAAITLEGLDAEELARVERLLARKVAGRGADDVERPLAEVVARPGFLWRELADHIAEQVSAFDERIAELRRACTGWDAAGDEDRVAWLRWWIADAFRSLPKRAPGTLPLFLASGEFAARRRAADARWGAKATRDAVRWRERHGNAVVRVSAGTRARAAADRLLAAGLARSGAEIPIEDLLAALDTRILAAFAERLRVPRGRTKAVTVVHLCRAGADARGLAEHVPLDEHVRLDVLPAPLDEVTLDSVDAPSLVPEAVATLLASSYVASVRAARTVERDAPSFGSSAAVELRCSREGDACAHCRRQERRRFALDRRPRMPLHPGCRCELHVVAESGPA